MSVAVALAVIALAGTLTACDSAASAPAAPSGMASRAAAGAGTGSTTAGTAALALATSLSVAGDSWAVVPVSDGSVRWEVLVRPTGSATWRLVTPPGIDDRGGLAAADGGQSLTVAVGPSGQSRFSPLAATTNTGRSWSAPTPLSTGVAAAAGALAAEGSRLLAAESDGAVMASSGARSRWRTIAGPTTIAASTAGRTCGGIRISSVSFGLGGAEALAAGACPAAGTTGLFSRSLTSGSGSWRRLSLPTAGSLVRLFPGGTMLLRGKTGLTMLWNLAATGWFAYAPLSSAHTPVVRWKVSGPLPVTSAVTASGQLAGVTPTAADGAWVLLPGGRAATISAPGKPWLLLPPLPAGTAVLASGPVRTTDALTVAGTSVTVWRLVTGATVWTKIQTVAVPVQKG